MRRRTLIWLLIWLSGAAAYVWALVEGAPPLLRLVCAWYALLVLCLAFTVVGVTLSAQFRRLDTPEGFLWRLFLLW